MKKLSNTFTGAGAPAASSGGGGQPNLGSSSGLGGLLNHGLNTLQKHTTGPLPFGLTFNDVRQHGLPNQWNDALKWNKTLKDPNQTWTSPERWDAAKNLNNWLQQNKSHGIVAKIHSSPDVQQQLSTYNSPIGQVGQVAGPMLGNFAKDPQRFAMMLNMPGIKELFQNTVGQAGVPGLALAHSYLSGNMKNWNALTAGLRDPSQRVPGRNFYQELSQGVTPTKSAGDVIDRYIARIHVKA